MIYIVLAFNPTYCPSIQDDSQTLFLSAHLHRNLLGFPRKNRTLAEMHSLLPPNPQPLT